MHVFRRPPGVRRRRSTRLIATLGAGLAVAATLSPGTFPANAVSGLTGTYTLAIIQVNYADATVHRFSLDQLNSARDEINTYFYKLSNHKLNVEVRVGTAELSDPSQTGAFYWDQCVADGSDPRSPCPPPLLQDAVTSAVSNGLDMSGVQGVVVLSPWRAGDFTIGPADITANGTAMTVQQSYDFEGCDPYPACPQQSTDPDPNFAPPGPSNVYWNGWAHEIGHQIEIQSGIRLYGNWNGHPGGYSSGYDLMDSGYPLGESVYGLSQPDIGDKAIFPGWLDASHVRTVGAPRSGNVTTTVHVTPMGEPPTTSTSDIRGVKLPVYRGVYLTVEARRSVGADGYGVSPGLFDQGIKLDSVQEEADPPEHPIDACDYLLPRGCVRSDSDSRWANCHAVTVPNLANSYPYCWPFELWHPGTTFTDAADNLSVAIGDYDPTTHTYPVTVTRGPNLRHPDVALNQWYSPPSNSAETTDIWVDSSCNGYGTYRYGQRADGTAIGNGDDPCANHPNRLYARVRNIGTAPAEHVVVSFDATDPLGVGIDGARGWRGINSANEAQFPELASIPPGGHVDVWVPWNPPVDISTLADPTDFAFHSCVRVHVTPVPGEIVTDNQDGVGEQENFQYFQGVVGSGGMHQSAATRLTVSGTVPLVNIDGKGVTAPRTYWLAAKSHLPPSGAYSFNGGVHAVTLAPGTTRQLPVKMSIPTSAPAGRIYDLDVDAWTLFRDTDPAISTNWPMPGPTHTEGGLIAGATLGLHTVQPTTLTLEATEDGTNRTDAKGFLLPYVEGQVITLDYVTDTGATATHFVKVDANGEFIDSIIKPPGHVATVRGIFTGTMANSSAVTEVTPTPVTMRVTARAN